MAFITNKGLYCYKVMPFDLKNVRTKYQRLVNKIYKNQIGCNMEVYIDDMLVKSKEAALHIDDLVKAFDVLRRYRMKLNPTKCAFSITSKKFFGFMVTKRGIETNFENIKTIFNMKPTTSQ